MQKVVRRIIMESELCKCMPISKCELEIEDLFGVAFIGEQAIEHRYRALKECLSAACKMRRIDKYKNLKKILVVPRSQFFEG